MAASNGGGGPGPGPISAEAEAALGEAIRLVFGRWTALQMAVENQWGGRDSRAKADQLGESILFWFCRTKGPYYFEDLVDMMYDKISESFNAYFEDNSIEEVAEQFLIIHEECLQNNYSSIEKLRNSPVPGNAVSQSRQIVGDDDDDSDSSDDGDDTSMVADEEAGPEEMAVDRPRPPKPTPDADGWTVVPPRRGGRSKK
ncbi:Pre-rRNA-processing protein TSR2 [Zea mays]|uniref:Pre-rRNA-processing protein TSR2 n=1 Tax=Zea mays TaxID=4577 RepID=A0A1D6GL55_MAIZE|nr:Pre-rRNA-processing protein TSR2 [Zea mays]AQK64047.1 Pre-rRNA-processing protein TSR2 [Zea mays]